MASHGPRDERGSGKSGTFATGGIVTAGRGGETGTGPVIFTGEVEAARGRVTSGAATSGARPTRPSIICPRRARYPPGATVPFACAPDSPLNSRIAHSLT